MFPETEAWFAARLRYTRSTAVMSMVGYVLGYVNPSPLPRLICTRLIAELIRLGDRHGENLSFEEGTGGILHVDFNCLFDKVRPFAHQISMVVSNLNKIGSNSG